MSLSPAPSPQIWPMLFPGERSEGGKLTENRRLGGGNKTIRHHAESVARLKIMILQPAKIRKDFTLCRNDS
jgi:hypothetical protein